jgi:hypothetical protein
MNLSIVAVLVSEWPARVKAYLDRIIFRCSTMHLKVK